MSSVNNNYNVKTSSSSTSTGGSGQTNPPPEVSVQVKYKDDEGNDKTGYETFGESNKLTGSKWDTLSEAGKKDLLNKWVDDPRVSLLLDDSALSKMTSFAKGEGYTVVNDKVDGENLTKFYKTSDKQIEKLNSEMSESGVGVDKNGNLEIGGKTYDKDNRLTTDAFGKLTAAQQEYVRNVWTMAYANDDVFDKGLVEKFEQDVEKEYGKYGSKIYDNYANMMNTADAGFDYIVSDRFIPELTPPTGVFTQDASDMTAWFSNASSWAFGLMLLSSQLQSNVASHTNSLMGITNDKDIFLFKKSLLLNTKRYEGLSVINKQMVKAARADRRGFFARIGDAFKKLFKGDIGGFFGELGGALLQLIPFKFLRSGVKLLLLGMRDLMLRIAIGLSTGDSEKLARLRQELEDTELIMKDGWNKLLRSEEMGDINDARLAEQIREAQALEDEVGGLNSLSDEELEFISYADIQNVIDWVDDTARTINTVMGWIADVVMGALVLFTGIIPILLGALAKDQFDTVMESNVDRVESEYRILQLNFRMSMMAALTDQLTVKRDRNKEELELLGKSIEMLMDHVKAVEELLDDILAKMVEMQDRAAARS